MSDALTDLARSERITEVFEYLLDAQISFLLKPDEKNLAKIYNYCSKLENLRGGFWGESGKSIAQKTREYYKARFGEEFNGNKSESKDVANLIENLRKESQLEYLAKLMTKKEIEDDQTRAYHIKFYKNYTQLKNSLSLTQAEELQKPSINQKTLEDIFEKIGFEI